MMQTEARLCFMLNHEVVTLTAFDPTLTLLQYLREYRQLTGSKEGCAEGDCGACTVVIAEARQGRIHWRSVNACIQFLPMLHGKAVLTVEALQEFGDGGLHPVQQAMVDYHASQCGFCTPGFVMSLFALFKTTCQPQREEIDQALSGNLCRCTGYRPIIEAARHMADYASPGHWLTQAGTSAQCADAEQHLLDQLTSIHSEATLALSYQNKQYFAPTSLADLLQLRAQYPAATLVAGNTDVGLWVNKQLRELPVIISLQQVVALKQIEITGHAIEIGAAVSLTDAFDALSPRFPQLKSLFQRFASMPVRNAGTLVGNIANGSPIGDLPPLMLALQAKLTLQSVSAERTLALDDFYLGYQQNDLHEDEIVTSIHIPLPQKDHQVACYKLSQRHDQDISALCAAFVLKVNGSGCVSHVRIAFGGMAAIPARAHETEKELLASSWTQHTVDAAAKRLAQDFSPLSDLRASAEYRLTAAANLLQRFYLETTRQSESVITLDDLSGVKS